MASRSGGLGATATIDRVVWNRAAIAKLARSPRASAAMLDVAREIARRAAANAGPYAKGGGGYRAASLEAGRARAGTDYSFAHWDEWGNIYVQPRGSLRRAVSSAGLRADLR